jgi:hypothetical protein
MAAVQVHGQCILWIKNHSGAVKLALHMSVENLLELTVLTMCTVGIHVAVEEKLLPRLNSAEM